MTDAEEGKAVPELIPSIRLRDVGKMYKLYRRPADKVMDALGINSWLFWRRDYYQEFWALRGLSLEVQKGERLGIIGRNGAGKSTLLKIISGNITATEGTVAVKGRIQALLELGTGFHPEFSGRQNIRVSLAYQGFSPEEIGEKEKEIVDFAELEEFIDQPLKTYSAGMYTRLAFSTATSIRPEIMIIDEVLGAGDAYFAGKCVDRMRNLTEESGATVLFVSHDLGSVQQLCERVVWIDRGELVQDGSPLEVTKAYYASILAQEERRLRTRNIRAGRGRAGSLPRTVSQEKFATFLFRFLIPGARTPRRKHPIRRLSLWKDKECLASVSPGAPMDNDASQSAHLLADRRYMLWGSPDIVQGERVRCVEATGGRYGHAPVAFSVPTEMCQAGELMLEVEHAAADDERVDVEFSYKKEYVRIGTLTPSTKSWRTERWPVPAEPRETGKRAGTKPPSTGTAGKPTASEGGQAARPRVLQDSDAVLKQRDVDKFYTDYADILEAIVTDKTGRPKVIFGPGETLGISVEVEARRPMPECGFSVTIYSLTNVVITSLFWPICGGLTAGRYRWSISFEHPTLRQHEYVISCGIIREFPKATNESTIFYCRWNRALSFRVEEGIISSVPTGLIVLNTQPPNGSEMVVSKIENQV